MKQFTLEYHRNKNPCVVIRMDDEIILSLTFIKAKELSTDTIYEILKEKNIEITEDGDIYISDVVKNIKLLTKKNVKK